LTSAGSSNFTFDATGNRTMTGYQTGPDNQLLSDGNWNYKYDPEGNLIEKDGVAGGPYAGLTWVYAYNNANTLISATESGSASFQVTYNYDVLGNRVEQDVTQSGNTTVTRFDYDKNGNAWADLNSSNAVVTRRLYLNAVDALFARVNSSGTEDWYLTDQLGSVRGLMNNSGTLDDAISYDAWGNIGNESQPSAGDRYKFTGREFDSQTGLQYNRARSYNPATGSWMSQDPKGFSAGDSNFYRYVTNSPTAHTDPSGEFPPGVQLPPGIQGDADGGLQGAPSVFQRLSPSQRRALAGAPYLTWVGTTPSSPAWLEGVTGTVSVPQFLHVDFPGTPGQVSFAPPRRRIAVAPLPLTPGSIGTAWDPDNSQNQAIGQTADLVNGMLASGAISGAMAVVPLPIRFGNNPNQTYHAFRHILKKGLSQSLVAGAIETDLRANAAALVTGLNIRSLVVAGENITYHAYKFANGVVNVGRITLP
jgi:RHS repeat-associated protein